MGEAAISPAAPVSAELPRPAALRFLESPLADAAALVLFASAGAAAGRFLWILPGGPALQGAAGALIALLGPVSCAIERGDQRPLGRALGLAMGAWSAAVYAALRLRWGDPAPLSLGLEGALLLGSGLLLPWLAPRLDRGEAGWRAAARRGPPDGQPPAARVIACGGRRGPLRWLGWLLLPLSWPLRLVCAGAILAYQLSFSRLMPPACRYEPTCSRYGLLAFWRHGVLRGGLLTSFRLLRCSPLGSGGHDPVPCCRNHEVSCEA